MQKIYCHSFMPPNVMTGIIFDWWWVVVFLWYIIMSDVDSVERWYGDKTETANSEQKVYVHDYMESDWVLYCRQTSKWYQKWIATISWQIYLFP
jgi:hypothetical protein